MKNETSKIINLKPQFELSPSGLLVSGELYISNSSMFGTEITLYDNGIAAQKYICCSNGFFFFKLDYEKTYTIVVSKAGYDPKTIEFNTSLHGYPAKRRNYEFGVTLTPSIENGFESYNYTPAALIRFISRNDGFEHDREYHEQRNKKQLNRKVA